jgi:hypothetical protein
VRVEAFILETGTDTMLMDIEPGVRTECLRDRILRKGDHARGKGENEDEIILERYVIHRSQETDGKHSKRTFLSSPRKITLREERSFTAKGASTSINTSILPRCAA